MKPSKQHTQKLLGSIGLAAIVQMGILPPSLAAETCADTFHAASPAKPEASKASSECPDYDQCIALGQQSLKDGYPQLAIEAFNKAVAAAGEDDAKRSNAYGCLGLSHDANADRAEAQANLENARAISGQKLAWVEKEYKRLLSTQKLMTAEDIERKLKADKKIMTAEQQTFTPVQEPLQTASAETGDDPTANMTTTRGFTIGKPAETTASMDDADKYRPKPLAQVTKPRPAPRHATASAKRKKSGGYADSRPYVVEDTATASLDLRINFEFRSADLTAEGKSQAEELGKALEKLLQDGKQQAVLVGHTDIFGSEDYNHHLSEDRAAAVKAFLIRTFPDLAGKLSERGMGMSQPLYKEKDEESQKLNRRVEVKLVPLPE